MPGLGEPYVYEEELERVLWFFYDKQVYYLVNFHAIEEHIEGLCPGLQGREKYCDLNNASPTYEGFYRIENCIRLGYSKNPLAPSKECSSSDLPIFALTGLKTYKCCERLDNNTVLLVESVNKIDLDDNPIVREIKETI